MRIAISLFGGMECGREVFKQLGIKIDTYISSEIEKAPIKVASKNHPDIIHVGDVTKWRTWNIDWSKVDFISAGSPCQGFSVMGKMLAFNDPRSRLFFVFVKIYEHAKKFNPNVKFLLENVNMKQDNLDIISGILNVKPLCINSSLVSAQNRKRWYWTNIEGVTIPDDRKIMLTDIIPGSVAAGLRGQKVKGSSKKWTPVLTLRKDGKSNCLVTGISSTGRYVKDNELHFITVEQAERLQTLPVGYTDVKGVSTTAKFKMIGNGWTIEVIKLFYQKL